MTPRRLVRYSQVVFYVAAAFTCVALGVVALLVRAELHTSLTSITQDIHGSTQQLNSSATQLTTTMNAVGDELTSDADRLTTRADRLMIVTGATATEAHKASEYQRQFWETETPRIANKVNRLLDASHSLVLGVGDTNTHLRADLDKLTHSSVETLTEGQRTFKTFTDLVQDPDFLTIKHNMARISANGGSMSDDAQYKFHRFAHPEELSKKQRAWRYTIGGLGLVKDLMEINYYWP